MLGGSFRDFGRGWMCRMDSSVGRDAERSQKVCSATIELCWLFNGVPPCGQTITMLSLTNIVCAWRTCGEVWCAERRHAC